MHLKTYKQVLTLVAILFILSGCSSFNKINTSNVADVETTEKSNHQLVVNDNTDVYVYGDYGQKNDRVDIDDYSGQRVSDENSKRADDNQFRGYVVADENNIFALVKEELYIVQKDKTEKICDIGEIIGLIGCNSEYVYFYDKDGIGRYSINDNIIEKNYILKNSGINTIRAVVNSDDLVLSYKDYVLYEEVDIYNDKYENGKISITLGDPDKLDMDVISEILPDDYLFLKNQYMNEPVAIALMKQEGNNFINTGCYLFEYFEDIEIYSIASGNNIYIKRNDGVDTLGYSGRLSFQNMKAIQLYTEDNYNREDLPGGDYYDAYFDLYCPKEYWSSDNLKVYDLPTEKYELLYETNEYRILGYDATNDYIYLFDVPSNTVKRLENTTQTVTDVFIVEDAEIIRFWWSGNDLIWMYENGGVVTYGGYKQL